MSLARASSCKSFSALHLEKYCALIRRAVQRLKTDRQRTILSFKNMEYARHVRKFFSEGVKRERATRGEISVQSVVHVLAGFTSSIVIT